MSDHCSVCARNSPHRGVPSMCSGCFFAAAWRAEFLTPADLALVCDRFERVRDRLRRAREVANHPREFQRRPRIAHQKRSRGERLDITLFVDHLGAHNFVIDFIEHGPQHDEWKTARGRFHSNPDPSKRR